MAPRGALLRAGARALAPLLLATEGAGDFAARLAHGSAAPPPRYSGGGGSARPLLGERSAAGEEKGRH